MRNAASGALVAGLVTLAGLAHGADGVTLRLVPTERVELRVEVEERIGDGFDFRRTGSERFSISLVPDGDELLATITLEHGRGQLRQGAAKREYDTDVPDAPPLEGLVRARAPAVIRLSRKGEVLGLVSVDGRPPDETATGRERELVEFMWVEYLGRGAALGIQVPYPADPVSFGGRWTSFCERALPGLTPVRADVENVVVEADAGRVVVVQDGDAEIETRNRGRAAMSVRGRMVVSTRDGLPLEGEVRVGYSIVGPGGFMSSSVTRRWSRVVPPKLAPPQPGAY